MLATRDADGRILVVADTCVVVNFILAERLDLLTQHLDYRFVITEQTREEVEVPEELQKVEATPGILLKAILNGTLSTGDAGAIKARLERHRFVMSFNNFAELVQMDGPQHEPTK